MVQCLEFLNIPYFITGSIASMAYGEPRLTNDIDIVVDMKEEHIPRLKKWFPENDFYLSNSAALEAIHHRKQFNIIHGASGLKIDIIIHKKTPFDHSRFERIKRMKPTEEFDANFTSPEDIIIKKMDFYKEGESEKHLRDIAGIFKIYGKNLDTKYIEEWVNRLGLIDVWNIIEKKLKEK